MKCHEARELLVPHLNNEITRSERELLQSHLTECERCWHAFNGLSSAQQQLRRGMAEYAANAQPADVAWPRLQRELHARRTPARVQWSGRSIASGLSTLVATASAALLILGGLITPAALNRPIAAVTPAQTIIVNQNNVALTHASPPTQPALLGTLLTPGNPSYSADESRLSDIEMRILKNMSKSNRPARAQIEAVNSTAAGEDGIDRLSAVPNQQNLFRKVSGNVNRYNTEIEVNCPICTRKE
jgi:Putative zinc-finger